jgi:hypothetical protein
MLELSGPDLAELAQLPYPSLVKYQRQGIVGPSVHLGEGTGTVSKWSFVDLVAVASFGFLRPSATALGTLKALFDAWHRPRARDLVAAVMASAAGQRKGPSPAFILVADDGRVVIEKELRLSAACKKYGPRVFVVDSASLVEKLLLEATTQQMTAEPDEEKPRKNSNQRKRSAKVPALVLEASTRHGEKKTRRDRP